jgi:hypothetical protein
MGRHLKSDHYTRLRSEAAIRRVARVMCMACVTGSHSLCASEDCPCVCNDSDFRWSRKAASETQQEMAQVIAVRPELAELFR